MSEDEMNTGGAPDAQHDETLRDVIASLSALSAVDERDVQRIVARAAVEAEETGRRGEHRWAATRPARDVRNAGIVQRRAATPRWFTAIPLAAAAGLVLAVLAAGIGGFALRSAMAPGDSGGASQAASVSVPAPRAGDMMGARAVVADASAEATIDMQFVLEAPDASHVSLVGAFNTWDAAATPLVRDPSTGLWAVTLPLAPGRHVYAFMVNDTTLTLDPRAPTTRDPDLGTSGSVILVGTP